MGLFPRSHFSIKSLQNVFYITQKKERERTVLLGGGGGGLLNKLLNKFISPPGAKELGRFDFICHGKRS